ncbi:hypothetical protein GHT06_019412 [Daphnia sinensis]|uniref:Secreted protein n=1 Tax=Daphnia sinensis TaxID=1820382 RepID=A0AAD5L0T6_9CRUS|nr:hypothetical protein GHT06_019412 [Daphnia sinensis]
MNKCIAAVLVLVCIQLIIAGSEQASVPKEGELRHRGHGNHYHAQGCHGRNKRRCSTTSTTPTPAGTVTAEAVTSDTTTEAP